MHDLWGRNPEGVPIPEMQPAALVAETLLFGGISPCFLRQTAGISVSSAYGNVVLRPGECPGSEDMPDSPKIGCLPPPLCGPCV